MTIPEQAVQAAAEKIREVTGTYAEVAHAALTAAAPHLAAVRVPDVDALAQEIRRVDGNHDKGAAALAEALIPFLSALEPSASRAAVLEEAAIFEALEECETYFENRSDADHDETGFVPNEEMRILVSVRAAIRALASHPVADKPDEAGAQGEGWLPMTHPDLPLNGASVVMFDSFVPGKDGFGQVIARFDKTHGWHVSASVVGGVYIKLTNPIKWRPIPTPPSSEVA